MSFAALVHLGGQDIVPQRPSITFRLACRFETKQQGSEELDYRSSGLLLVYSISLVQTSGVGRQVRVPIGVKKALAKCAEVL